MNSFQFFSPEAEQRLIQIFPENGIQRFENLNKFISIAVKHKGTALVVPPEIDTNLHEVLAARDFKGEGFEKIKLNHIFRSELGESVGKKLNELPSPIAKNTLKILDKEGFKINFNHSFEQGACTLTVL